MKDMKLNVSSVPNWFESKEINGHFWINTSVSSFYNLLEHRENNETKNATIPEWDDKFCQEDGISAEDDDGDPMLSGYFKLAVYILYLSIFFIALLGNGTVCYIVGSSPRMRTVTNYFIVNLAVGDILMSLFCIPFSFISILILRHWPFGAGLCHIVNYSQAISVLISAYTLVAISIDRYIAIMWPLRPRVSKRNAKCIIAFVWLVALFTALPIPIVSELEYPSDWHRQCKRYICREHWPSEEYNFYYTIVLLTLQFAIPLSVLIFTYVRIGFAVWGKYPPGEAENSRDQRMANSKRKMIKMMVMVVIVFSGCWLPFNVIVFIVNHEHFRNWKPLPYLWFASHWLAMSHSCYNPIIYCFMNARFRLGFHQILLRIPFLRKCFCLQNYAANPNRRSVFGMTGDSNVGMEEMSHLRRMSRCNQSLRRDTKCTTLQTNYSCSQTTLIR